MLGVPVCKKTKLNCENTDLNENENHCRRC